MFRTMISLVLQVVEMGKWEMKSIKITKFGKDRGSAIKSPKRRKTNSKYIHEIIESTNA